MIHSSTHRIEKEKDLTQEQIKKVPMFSYFVERFADFVILRYEAKDFNSLTLKQKKLLYFLSEAALSGRDIIWDQNYRYNLVIRRTLEEIIKNFNGDRTSNEFKNFMVYVKQIWFANGIHHHYSNDKFKPEFSKKFFGYLIAHSPSKNFPLQKGELLTDLVERLYEFIFNPDLDNKKVSLVSDGKMVVRSAVNFYRGFSTDAEVQDFYTAKIAKANNTTTPISYGLNSRLVKKNNSSGEPQIYEEVYKINGLYGKAIEKIVYWLDKAKTVAESDLQHKSIELLIEYYQTGDLEKFNEYNILWIKDVEPRIDFINGFIENYNDPFGFRGSWESVVSIKDIKLTKKYEILAKEAKWFEDHSPIKYKKTKVQGISYKIITVITESGDSSPATPIGINLPNENWIRTKHGSKSVSLRNIEDAYEELSKSNGSLQEFYLTEQIKWIKKYGHDASRISTGLHEVIGHASGRIKEGVGNFSETLKNYSSTLEEARADLVALYYIGDPHLVDLGLVSSTDVMKAEYNIYITNGLLRQLVRIEIGKDIEQTHMRNRQLISKWVFEKGKTENIITKIDITNGENTNTYFKINNYQKLKKLFGELLVEVQRIKSEGDYAAGKSLVETYGVKVDLDLHKQVKRRWAKHDIASHTGFLNPILTPIKATNGEITNIKVSYQKNFTEQMLYYASNYSFLNTYN